LIRPTEEKKERVQSESTKIDDQAISICTLVEETSHIFYIDYFS
jgi:hypothetical protein